MTSSNLNHFLTPNTAKAEVTASVNEFLGPPPTGTKAQASGEHSLGLRSTQMESGWAPSWWSSGCIPRGQQMGVGNACHSTPKGHGSRRPVKEALLAGVCCTLNGVSGPRAAQMGRPYSRRRGFLGSEPLGALEATPGGPGVKASAHGPRGALAILPRGLGLRPT